MLYVEIARHEKNIKMVSTKSVVGRGLVYISIAIPTPLHFIFPLVNPWCMRSEGYGTCFVCVCVCVFVRGEGKERGLRVSVCIYTVGECFQSVRGFFSWSHVLGF